MSRKKNKRSKAVASAQKEYLRILERVTGKSVAISPGYARTAFGILVERMGGQLILPAGLMEDEEEFEDDEGQSTKSYHVTENGTAIIETRGTMMAGYGGAFSSLGAYYGDIANTFREAAADDEVQRVANYVGSHGGEVNGCQTCAVECREAMNESGKPWHVFIDEYAHSAALWQSSQADKVYLPPMGDTGSCGVVMAHTDYSQNLANNGIKVTMIYAGAKKVQGNVYEPLSDDDLKELTQECEDIRHVFASDVAEGRTAAGKEMTTQHMLNTEAACYMGQKAVDIGLADGVMHKGEFMNAFEQINPRNTSVQVPAGIIQTKKGTSTVDEELQSKIDAAVKAAMATQKEGFESQLADMQSKLDQSESEKAAMKRTSDVLQSESAMGRQEKAAELLESELYTSLSAEAIIGLLASFPMEDGFHVGKDDTEQMKSLMRNARGGANDHTSGIRSQGHGRDQDLGGKGEPGAGVDKNKKIEYADTVSDKTTEFELLKNAAAKVGDHLKRSHI
ncbi:hypothetical protein ACH42_06355 [Endozoicomonas sp. (ex Bugula neritina AB1)]|nr:hypothetical protein ACH42_06355 [Endozoicomonas sp. (ex Bugula neritina AB1)]